MSTQIQSAPQTLEQALDVIRAMHLELLAFRNPEFDLIAPGREGEFDDRVKGVLALSAPVIGADRAAAAHSDFTGTAKPVQAMNSAELRVMPPDVEDNISAEFYFTASDGIKGAAAVHGGYVAPHCIRYSDAPAEPSTNLLTFCVLVLSNGFTVTGESSYAGLMRFSPEAGRHIARVNAINKIHTLMRYELCAKQGGATG